MASSSSPPTDGRRELAFLEALLEGNVDNASAALHAPFPVLPTTLPGTDRAPDSVDLDGFSCRIGVREIWKAMPSTFNASVGGETIPTSSKNLQTSKIWRFVCTINGNMYLHIMASFYDIFFKFLSVPMLPSADRYKASSTNRQTLLVGDVFHALTSAECPEVALVCYGLKQRLTLRTWNDPSHIFECSSHGWVETMLNLSSFFTVDIGLVWSEDGNSFSFSKPGSVSGLRHFGVYSPMQSVTRTMSYLQAHPEDPHASLMPKATWESGTVTAYGGFLKGLGGKYALAANGAPVGHTCYTKGLGREKDLPKTAAMQSGVAAVNLYNHHTRHVGVASEAHPTFKQIGSLRRKNRSPGAQTPGPGQTPPRGAQEAIAAARDRHNEDLRRDFCALEKCVGVVTQFPKRQYGGVRSEGKVVSVSPATYSFAKAFRDGCLAAGAVADTNCSGIRVHARVPIDVQNAFLVGVVHWARAARGDPLRYAHMLRGIISQMGTHIMEHSASRAFIQSGAAVRIILAPVASVGFPFEENHPWCLGSSSGAKLMSICLNGRARINTRPKAEIQREFVLARQRLVAARAGDSSSSSSARKTDKASKARVGQSEKVEEDAPRGGYEEDHSGGEFMKDEEDAPSGKADEEGSEGGQFIKDEEDGPREAAPAKRRRVSPSDAMTLI